jgi:hypothetical protein
VLIEASDLLKKHLGKARIVQDFAIARRDLVRRHSDDLLASAGFAIHIQDAHRASIADGSWN